MVNRNSLRDTSACLARPVEATATAFTATLTSSAAPVTVTDGTTTYTAVYSGSVLLGLPENFLVLG
jgi:hypothetical protein